MEFTFKTEFCTVVVQLLRWNRLLVGMGHVNEEKTALRFVYEDDTLIREVYQWAAAAFACGLIESPRIERM